MNQETLTAEQWNQVGELFDRLVDLPTTERSKLVGENLPAPVRDLLEQMLAAHDSDDPRLLDQTVRAVAGSLFARQIASPSDYCGRRFGPWRALEEIGRGGMAVVLKGERADGQFEKEVAIKLLPHAGSSNEQDRLLKEIRIAARMEHTNIARLIDSGITDDQTPYLVMEYVHGVPITDYCDSRKLDTAARVQLFLQVIEAVLYAHRLLIVHCDIKPANILVSMDGQVKLVDFGIARMINAPHEMAPPAWFCTPGYCAPEQFKGAAPDTAQDVFSLGATLHELVFDRPIRDNRTATRMFVGLEQAPEATTPQLPERHGRARDLFAICQRALAHDPGQRYGSASSLLADLQRLLAIEPVEARNGGVSYRLGLWIRRYWMPAIAAGVAALALLVGSAVALWQAQQTRIEANRAQLALEQSEHSLRRAEAVREFLLELFRSAQPDRPRDQLPSTDEILALGARRALDETLAPPADRFAMLDTLAEVYLGQYFLDQARPLIAAAHALAFDGRQQRPADLARALRQQAWLAMRERDFETAEARFLEAILWAEKAPSQIELAHSLRADFGLLKIHQHDVPQAIAILEPLYIQVSDAEPGLRRQIVHALQMAHSLGGNLEATLALHDELTPLVLAQNGPDSLRFAIHLANGAGTKRELGLFSQARHDLVRAIELYDGIFDRPVEYRAAARTQLARVYYYEGRYQHALDEFAASTKEWAQATLQEPAAYPFLHIHRGRVLARTRDWNEAERSLAEAARLLAIDSRGVSDHLTYVTALQAWSSCSRSPAEPADQLAAMLTTLDGQKAGMFEYQAQVHEARAQCLMQLGQLTSALNEIELALALEDAPGRALVIADRRLLRSRLLQALGRTAEIPAELDGITQMLERLALTDSLIDAQLSSMRMRLEQ